MPSQDTPPEVSADVIRQLAPHGTLRAALNLSNFLLVSGKDASGEHTGVAPDMARAIAERLGVPLKLVPYPSPGVLADAAGTDTWDICLIGAEPARAEKIAFTRAYVEIEATYLLPPGSPIQHISEVDRPGVRIAVSQRTAYDLWLVRNIRHAQLVHEQGFDATFELFVRDKLDAMASLRPRLLSDVQKMPGSRILDGQFTAIQQSVGTLKPHAQAAAFLSDFVEQAKADGLVKQLIERHNIQGLSVAPASPSA